MSFSEQLKNARLNTGYTQQQVAEFMGITKSTYCGYETGKRQPDVAKIKQLASILNTSGDILLETGFTNKSSTECNEMDGLVSNEANSKLSPTKKRLIAEIEKMSDSELDAVKVFINSLGEYKKAFNASDTTHPTQF